MPLSIGGHNEHWPGLAGVVKQVPFFQVLWKVSNRIEEDPFEKQLQASASLAERVSPFNLPHPHARGIYLGDGFS